MLWLLCVWLSCMCDFAAPVLKLNLAQMKEKLSNEFVAAGSGIEYSGNNKQ